MRTLNEQGRHAHALADFGKAHRIRRIRRPDHDQALNRLANRLHGVLTVGRGIADVVAPGAGNVGETRLERADHGRCIVDRKGGLR